MDCPVQHRTVLHPVAVAVPVRSTVLSCPVQYFQRTVPVSPPPGIAADPDVLMETRQRGERGKAGHCPWNPESLVRGTLPTSLAPVQSRPVLYVVSTTGQSSVRSWPVLSCPRSLILGLDTLLPPSVQPPAQSHRRRHDILVRTIRTCSGREKINMFYLRRPPAPPALAVRRMAIFLAASEVQRMIRQCNNIAGYSITQIQHRETRLRASAPVAVPPL
jgi:hypothetical protein